MKDFMRKIGMSRSIDDLLKMVDDEHERVVEGKEKKDETQS
jgi:hypothetical protein